MEVTSGVVIKKSDSNQKVDKIAENGGKILINFNQETSESCHVDHRRNSAYPIAKEKLHGSDVQNKDAMTRNIYFFVANICLVNMFYMILTAYTNGVVRTVERRFGLSSYQTGFLNSCNDIVHIMVVVFVGYFGQKGNKPRIMCVTAMFSAVSGILNATPHFLFPDQALNKSAFDHVYPQINSRTNGLNVTDYSHISISSKYCRSSPFELESRGNSFQNQCSKEESSVHPAYYVFLVSQLVNGIGSSAIFTLSMAYIDENSPKNKASIFIGAYTSLYALGPVLGLFLSSLCLKLPENLFSGSASSTTDPSFIGCWWLGYLIGGVGLAFFSVLLWFHPRNSRHSRASFQKVDPLEMKSLTDSDSDDDVSESVLTQLRGLPKALSNLLKNKLYLVNLCLIVTGAYTIYGVFVNIVRYLEVHFFRSAAEASVIAGSLLAVSGLFGGFTGGTLISKLKLKTTGGIKLVLVLSLTFAIGLVVLINLGCPQVKMDMTMDPDIQENVVTNDCNRDCQCLTSRKHFQPICGSDGISYFSPCIAGCSHKINDTFVNCKCINASSSSSKSSKPASHPVVAEDGTATSGYCVGYCYLLPSFIITMFVVSLSSTIAKVPSTMVTFRIVSNEERSFALGVNSFVLNLCGFIPGPMIFGKLIDSTCLLWQRTCDTTGACLLFDTDRLRKYTYGASLIVEAVTFFGNLCLLLMIRKSSLGMIPLSRQFDTDVNL